MEGTSVSSFIDQNDRRPFIDSLIESGATSMEEQDVRCYHLPDLLRALGIDHVDLFVLDVEGYELNVTLTLEFDAIRYDVMLIENNHQDAVKEVMLRNGYVLLAIVGADSVYVRKDSPYAALQVEHWPEYGTPEFDAICTPP